MNNMERIDIEAAICAPNNILEEFRKWLANQSSTDINLLWQSYPKKGQIDALTKNEFHYWIRRV